MSEQHLGEDLLAFASQAGLDPARRAEFEGHVASCAACQSAVAESRRVLELVDALPSAPIDPSARSKLIVRLDAIDAEAASGLRRLFTLPRVGALAAVFGAALVAVLLLRPTPDAELEPAGGAETLELAENLDLYEELDVVENLDVLDDLDLIESLENEPG